MDKQHQQLILALARAGRLLEEMGQDQKTCPLNYQPEPRTWCMRECGNCTYNRSLPTGAEETTNYEPDSLAVCWVAYLLWEGKQDARSSSSA
ncbi:MAG: hypothetical protein ACM3PP_03995 [Candidatus Saccharibacteria bacterium]